MRPKIRLTDEKQKEAVSLALEACVNPQLRLKLTAIRLAYGGSHTLSQISAELGVARSTVAVWIRVFRKEGLGGIEQLAKKGVQMDEESSTELLADLRKGKWKRARDIQHWLSGRGVKLKLTGVYSWLRRVGAKPKVPRKTHAKKDPAKALAFQSNLSQQLKDLGIASGKPIRLWVADEHRFGLISVLRRVWTLRGCRPTAPYQTKYQWSYLYSALEIGGEGRAEGLFAPTVNLDWSRAFLEQIAERDPQAEHVVIWDQAGFHQKAASQDLPPRLHIVSLPPYSPELNPVEKIGLLIKNKIANRIFETLDQIEAAVSEEMQPIWKQAERVHQLVGQGWLLNQVNSSYKLFSPI